jgi:hypothetical protein
MAVIVRVAEELSRRGQYVVAYADGEASGPELEGVALQLMTQFEIPPSRHRRDIIHLGDRDSLLHLIVISLRDR